MHSPLLPRVGRLQLARAFLSASVADNSIAVFLLYVTAAVAVVLYLIFGVSTEEATSNIFVYIGICSVAGSLSVMSCKVRRGGVQGA